MDILVLLIVFVVGYFVGITKANFQIAHEIKEAADALGIDLEKELVKKQESENSVYKLAVEKHGDMLYLFERETDNFICQGSNVQELADKAQKYKNIVAAIAVYDDKVFMFQNGKSKEYTSNES